MILAGTTQNLPIFEPKKCLYSLLEGARLLILSLSHSPPFLFSLFLSLFAGHHECDVCEKSFASAKSLTRHIVKRHPNIFYKCNVCGEGMHEIKVIKCEAFL